MFPSIVLEAEEVQEALLNQYFELRITFTERVNGFMTLPQIHASGSRLQGGLWVCSEKAGLFFFFELRNMNLNHFRQKERLGIAGRFHSSSKAAGRPRWVQPNEPLVSPSALVSPSVRDGFCHHLGL